MEGWVSQEATAAGGPKAPRPGEETAEVIVTVKTYPNPSETYGENVCVAGVRLDRGRPEWIRLYPAKFRNADFDSQFRSTRSSGSTGRAFENLAVPGTDSGSPARNAARLSFGLPRAR